LSSFSPSALGFGCQTLDRIVFLSSTCLSTSSCCSSWHRCWTLLFWDLVKPSGHHYRLGFLQFWLDPSSSSSNVRWRSWARHMISSSGTRESAISSSRLFEFSLTRPPNDHEHWPWPPVDRRRWLAPQPIVDWDPLITEFTVIPD
jgi:hypothetical protein